MTTIAALRRQLYARGLTPQPSCPMCRATCTAADLDAKTGACWTCARRVLALRRLELIDLKLIGLWAASREETDPARLEAIDSEMYELEGERMELYYTEVAPEESSHA